MAATPSLPTVGSGWNTGEGLLSGFSMRHSKVAHVSINLNGIGNSHEKTTVEMQPETLHYLAIFRGREVEWKRGWGGSPTLK